MGEKYSWDRFYPDHCSDKIVEMMISEDVDLVQGSGLEEGNLADAFLDIEEEANRLKVIYDLIKDGYLIRESDILELFKNEGDSPVLFEMIKLYQGTFSKQMIITLYDWGTDIELSDILDKSSKDLDFTEKEIVDILYSVGIDDEGIFELLNRYNPPTISKDTVIEILENIPDSANKLAKKYVNMLPFDDRVDILEDYY